MGFTNSQVDEALKQQKFDDCYASYLLLGRRNTDVSLSIKNIKNINLLVYKELINLQQFFFLDFPVLIFIFKNEIIKL